MADDLTDVVFYLKSIDNKLSDLNKKILDLDWKINGGSSEHTARVILGKLEQINDTLYNIERK